MKTRLYIFLSLLFLFISFPLFAGSTVSPNPGKVGETFTFTLTLTGSLPDHVVNLKLGDGGGGWQPEVPMQANAARTEFTYSRIIEKVGTRVYKYSIYDANTGAFVGYQPSSGTLNYEVLELQLPVFSGGVFIQDISGGFALSWNSASGQTGYELYRSTSSGSLGTKIYSGSSRSYNDTSLSNGVTYYYTAKACNNDGCTTGTQDFKKYVGQLATPVLSNPSTNAPNISKTSQNYDWNSIPGATSYRLVVSEYSDFVIDFNDTGIDTSSCTNTITCKTAKMGSSSYSGFSLKYGTKYYWKVRAGSSTIEASNWSSVKSFTTSSDPNFVPDLIVEGTAVNATVASVGQRITITSVVKNVGTKTSDAAKLRYYLSPNSTITTSDNELSTDNFPALAPNETSSEGDGNIINQSGVVYLGVCADSVAGEVNTTNNCSPGIRLDVNTDPLGPDITIDSFSIDKNLIASGERVTLSTVLKNSGSVTSVNGTLQYYYSLDSNISPSDTVIGRTDEFNAMLVGRTTSEIEGINLSLPAGTYYLGACADPMPGEKSSSNNCSVAKQITVTAAQFTLSVSTTGIGTGTITSTPAGISCSSGSVGCSTSFDEGKEVVLQISHPVNSYLTTWGGDCAFRTDLTNCTLTIDGNKTVTADFASTVPVLTQENVLPPFYAPISGTEDIILSLKGQGNYDLVAVTWTGGKEPVNQSKIGNSGDILNFAYPFSAGDTGKTVSWTAKAQYFINNTTFESETLTGSFYIAEKVGDCSAFIQDVTIPDGTRILINTPFTKTWKIKNCGTYSWDNYKLSRSGIDRLGTVPNVSIQNGITPGQKVDVSVAMQSPNAPGDIKSYWKVENSSGQQFDSRIFAYIKAHNVSTTVTNTGNTNIQKIVQTEYSTQQGECTGTKTNSEETSGVTFSESVQKRDPIDPSTGAQIFTLNLLSVSGIRNVDFTLHYNSLILSSSSVGTGWGHDHEVQLEELTGAEAGNVRISWRSNRENFYTLEADGSYTGTHHEVIYDDLVKNPDGSFSLTRRGQGKYNFNADGQLINHESTTGKELIYTHNESGLVAMITEPVSGVFLQFNYNDNFLLESVTDPLNRKVELFYNFQGQLIGYNDTEGNKTRYTLNESGQLLSGTNEENIRFFLNTFDEAGRITYQINGNDILNDQFNLDYSGDTDAAEFYSVVTTNAFGDIQTIVYQDEYLVKEIIDEFGEKTTFEYTPEGKPKKITDAAGNFVEQEFDTEGNLISVKDPLGHITYMTYDSHNNLLSRTDAENNVTSFTYDNNNNILTQEDAEGNITAFTYTLEGLLETITTPKLRTTTYTYENGRVKTITDHDNFSVHLDYDLAGRVVSTIDADGFKTTLVLDNLNRVIETIDAENNIFRTSYDSRNNIISTVDAKGNLTRLEYDGNDNLVKRIDALNNVTQYFYDAEDRLIQVRDPKNAESFIEYDIKGRVVKTRDARGNIHRSEFDKVDNLVKEIDPLNQETLYNYNALNNIVDLIDALNQSSHIEYDKNSNPIATLDKLGRRTSNSFDALNRLIESVDALDGIASQNFTEDGELADFTDPNENTTSFAYNDRGLVSEEQTASGSTTKYEYNGRKLVTKVTNARNQVQTLVYDKASRPKTVIDEVGTTGFVFDANSNLKTVTDAQGTITRTYDELNRISTYTNTTGEILEYLYDENSNVKTLIYPDGKRVEYSYDELNRLVSVVDWAGRGTVYEYNPNSLLSRITRPNGSVQTRLYNEINQLVEQKDLTSTGEVIYQVNYVRDLVGNITEEIINPQPDIEAILSNTMSYAPGNRINSRTKGTQNISVTETFDFDLDGNTIKAPFNGVDTTLVFNARNQLTSALGFSYQYDAEGYRTQLTNAEGIATRFTVNPEAVLSQVLASHSEGKTTYYVFGLGLIGQEVEGVYHNYHFDYRGSTVALTDNAGVITDRFTYTPFADLASHTGTTETPFQYNGRDGVMNDANGLIYMRARYYAPEFHRFINRDVLLGGIASSKTLNRFGYVEGNPVMGVDPSGLCTGTAGQGACSQATNPSPYSVYKPGKYETVLNNIKTTIDAPIIDGIRQSCYSSNSSILACGRDKFNGAMHGLVSSCLDAFIRPVVKCSDGRADGCGETIFTAATLGYSRFATGFKGALKSSNISKPPSFIVSPNGTVFPVPKGSKGPVPVINPSGNQTGNAFINGESGFNGQVNSIRIMNPTPPRGSSPGYINGYIKYQNNNGQGVNPYTGRTIPNSENHYPIN